MKVLGWELRERTAYNVILVSSIEGGNVLAYYAKTVYDSISRNWKWYNRYWNSFRFSPSKILKKITQKELIEAVKFIRLLEGAKEEDLIYFDFQLGKVQEGDFMEYVESAKKKVKKIQELSKLHSVQD